MLHRGAQINQDHAQGSSYLSVDTQGEYNIGSISVCKQLDEEKTKIVQDWENNPEPSSIPNILTGVANNGTAGIVGIVRTLHYNIPLPLRSIVNHDELSNI